MFNICKCTSEILENFLLIRAGQVKNLTNLNNSEEIHAQIRAWIYYCFNNYFVYVGVNN